MVFSSLIFLYGFLPLCLALYYLAPGKRWRNGVLVVTSLVFYAWGEPVWVLLLVMSCVVDYFNARYIEKHRGSPKAKLGVVFSLVFNLGVLAAFKYSGFFVANIDAIFGLALPVPAWHLPIGISFYTFQTISYVIDVYRGEVPAQRQFHKFLLYVSLFHQLVAGPIVRYKDVANEVEDRHFSWEDFSYGISRLAVGLGKKVILANSAGLVASIFLGAEIGHQSVLGLWWGMLFFAFQIFFDFSGYSDMAIGLGRMYGFKYKENFNYPYVARSATDFWRRWHMSLGSFFRDYLYVPLGGNRRRVYLNLAIVWFLTGLWHGASWNFVLWGGFYGALIIVEKLVGSLTGDRDAPAWLAHPYLILLTLVGWNFFYFTDVSQALAHLGAMFGAGGLPLTNSMLEMSVSSNVFLAVAAIVCCIPIVPAIKARCAASQGKLKSLYSAWTSALWPVITIALIGVSTVLLVGKSYNPFLYFRF